MWWKATSRRTAKPRSHRGSATVIDEAFLRRLERLALNVSPLLRGGLSGAHRSRRHLPAPTFSDHRAYSPSDDLRYVDWNAYARQEQLFVKLGETEQNIAVHLLIDQSTSMDYGEHETNKLQYARLLAATIGYLALNAGDSLSTATFDSALATIWGPHSTKLQAMSLLKFVAAIHEHGTSQIEATVQRYARDRKGGMLVIVSDLWTVQDIVSVLRAAPPPRWQVVLLHLLHPDELDPAIEGELELEDSETGDRITIDLDSSTLASYQQRMQAHCRTIETACLRYGAHYAQIETTTSLERAVIPWLQQRQLLRGA